VRVHLLRWPVLLPTRPPSPNVDLIAGETYFVGFQNVQELLVNFAFYQDPPATQLGGVYYDFGTDWNPSNTFNQGPEGGCCSAVGQPIIEFVGNLVAVPGPNIGTGYSALVLTLIGLARWSLRRKNWRCLHLADRV
jgi:hypothetical protein